MGFSAVVVPIVMRIGDRQGYIKSFSLAPNWCWAPISDCMELQSSNGQIYIYIFKKNVEMFCH